MSALPVKPSGSKDLPQTSYDELLELENYVLVANKEPIECPICFGAVQPYEGIVLRDCLHSFCSECLVDTIQHSDDVEIRCPYRDNVYSCESVLQQREINALVSKEVYEAHLAKSIQQAEASIGDTFHCRTPNCRGWCIIEGNVTEFKCPVCTNVNCVACRTIHAGCNCTEYRNRQRLEQNGGYNETMLQRMLETGDAMRCPTCKMIVTKISGCDGLKCLICKTEICWATRGPRWGRAGNGDTSGGCRCGVNGTKCHPQCKNCH
ncbi:ranBP-type and C3HC4-type zinc finger-containing protein 1-like [Anopheles cruzii]|uniref:ranBP-type and C3HC4-type zinc finger-containing protein 1-like n=1 Tax=Anopheles cruzii TaxID=68878 RepID=UPI0022EC6326|nr:ranBP-type and C3HC4-type zinc finger-containing protein 1-like [Anopheles cruzii]